MLTAIASYCHQMPLLPLGKEQFDCACTFSASWLWSEMGMACSFGYFYTDENVASILVKVLPAFGWLIWIYKLLPVRIQAVKLLKFYDFFSLFPTMFSYDAQHLKYNV